MSKKAEKGEKSSGKKGWSLWGKRGKSVEVAEEESKDEEVSEDKSSAAAAEAEQVEAEAIAEMVEEMKSPEVEEEPGSVSSSMGPERPRSRGPRPTREHRPSIADLSRSFKARMEKDKRSQHIQSLLSVDQSSVQHRDYGAELENDLDNSLQRLGLDRVPSEAPPQPVLDLFALPEPGPDATPTTTESATAGAKKAAENPVVVAKATMTPIAEQLAAEQRLYRLSGAESKSRGAEAAMEEGLAEGGAVEAGRPWLAAFPLRPLLEDGDSLVEYRKASRAGGEAEAGTERGFQMELDLGRLLFAHHPLFAEEHVLAANLLRLWRAYAHVWRQGLPGHYANLADGVARAQEQLSQQIHAPDASERGRALDQHKLAMLNRELDRLEELRRKAQETEEKLLRALLQWWGWLDGQRREQGFAATSQTLLVAEEGRREGPGAVLTSNGQITPKDDCPAAEQRRREALERREVSLRITCDGAAVLQTPPKALNADFCLVFNRIFTLHLFQSPKSLLVQVLEREHRRRGLSGSWKMVGEVGVAIPSPRDLATKGVAPERPEVEFASEETQLGPLNTNGVGAGITLALTQKLRDFPAMLPRTSGVLQIGALWGRGKDGRPLGPPVGPRDALPEPVGSKSSDMNPVAEHIRELMEELDRAALEGEGGEAVGEPSGDFRLEPEELVLVSEEALAQDPRLRLLELRREGVPEFRLMRHVPALSRELPWDVFADYERRMEREAEGEAGRWDAADLGGLRDFGGLRRAGQRVLSQVRAEVVERLYSAQESSGVWDMVSEEEIPSLGTLGLMLIEEAGRPLKPVRKAEGTRRPVASAALQGRVRILVNVQWASNLPSRVEGEGGEADVVMEVEFQGHRASSSAVTGPRPVWQQLLSLPFRPPNDDFTPVALQALTDTLHFNLFDQLASSLPSDDREETSHVQHERRWLGGFRLPFSTLYQAGKIDGYFRLRVPPLLLSYESRSPTDHPVLKLLLALDPPLQTPESSFPNMESIESEKILTHSESWLESLKTSFPGRRHNPLVLKTDGRTALICRFLRAIAPPTEVTAKGRGHAAIVQAARIVSLIPFVPDPLLFPGMPDIWSSSDQFLEMLCGDEEEHAVLLWSWLAGLGHEAWLVMGHGLPEGPRAAYVLVDVPGSEEQLLPAGLTLVNASDGMFYSVSDPHCPLYAAGLVVSAENAWANVQTAEAPYLLRWELGRREDWRPLFSTHCPNPGLSSVQPETLDYRETSQALVTELRAGLERQLKLAIDEWRQYANPRWNFAAAQVFRGILVELEAGGGQGLSPSEHRRRLKDLTDSHHLHGFPLHMGFESVDAVLQQVKATHIHHNFQPELEFALAVHVQPYPNNILSVWVYLASLRKKRPSHHIA